VSSLVEELQRDALDSRVPLPDVLRGALVVATKLKLADFRNWVACELNGYGKDDGLPDYRVIRCQVRSTNPFDGRKIPWKFPTSELEEMVCRRRIAQSVAAIEQLLLSDTETELALSFSAEMQDALMQNCDDPFPPVPYSTVERSQLCGILDAVRNTILNWSLKLEEDGITGEGMSFSPKEKTIACEQAANLRPVVNCIMIEHMENSSIQQGTCRSRQRHTH